MELEKIALDDPYFVDRKLYPNVDFYSGIILKAMGFPTRMFTALFAVARTVGWISQWEEMYQDPQQRIRPPASGLRGSVKAGLRANRPPCRLTADPATAATREKLPDSTILTTSRWFSRS